MSAAPNPSRDEQSGEYRYTDGPLVWIVIANLVLFALAAWFIVSQWPWLFVVVSAAVMR